jgi:hypothetical protein
VLISLSDLFLSQFLAQGLRPLKRPGMPAH